MNCLVNERFDNALFEPQEEIFDTHYGGNMDTEWEFNRYLAHRELYSYQLKNCLEDNLL